MAPRRGRSAGRFIADSAAESSDRRVAAENRGKARRAERGFGNQRRSRSAPPSSSSSSSATSTGSSENNDKNDVENAENNDEENNNDENAGIQPTAERPFVVVSTASALATAIRGNLPYIVTTAENINAYVQTAHNEWAVNADRAFTEWQLRSEGIMLERFRAQMTQDINTNRQDLDQRMENFIKRYDGMEAALQRSGALVQALEDRARAAVAQGGNSTIQPQLPAVAVPNVRACDLPMLPSVLQAQPPLARRWCIPCIYAITKNVESVEDCPGDKGHKATCKRCTKSKIACVTKDNRYFARAINIMTWLAREREQSITHNQPDRLIPRTNRLTEYATKLDTAIKAWKRAEIILEKAHEGRQRGLQVERQTAYRENLARHNSGVGPVGGVDQNLVIDRNLELTYIDFVKKPENAGHALYRFMNEFYYGATGYNATGA